MPDVSPLGELSPWLHHDGYEIVRVDDAWFVRCPATGASHRTDVIPALLADRVRQAGAETKSLWPEMPHEA